MKKRKTRSFTTFIKRAIAFLSMVTTCLIASDLLTSQSIVKTIAGGRAAGYLKVNF